MYYTTVTLATTLSLSTKIYCIVSYIDVGYSMCYTFKNKFSLGDMRINENHC